MAEAHFGGRPEQCDWVAKFTTEFFSEANRAGWWAVVNDVKVTAGTLFYEVTVAPVDEDLVELTWRTEISDTEKPHYGIAIQFLQPRILEWLHAQSDKEDYDDD